MTNSIKEKWSKLFTIIELSGLDATLILPKEVIDKCDSFALSSYRTLNFTNQILEYIGKNNQLNSGERKKLLIFSKSFSHKFHCCHHFVQLLAQLYKNKELDKDKDFFI